MLGRLLLAAAVVLAVIHGSAAEGDMKMPECPEDQPPVMCDPEPCSLALCPVGTTCVNNNCGGCYAECVPITPAVQECEKIPPPIWGSYHCQTDNTGTERCYPACMEGYEFESPPAAEYVCVNGQFSPPGPYPNCRKSEAVQECEKIPPPIWGSYHCQTDNTGTERCYPACMEGYEFESPPAAEYVCVNGQFSPPGPYPNCRKSEAVQECEKIPPPIWGSYHCQTDNTGTERCYPACMEGYEFESPPAAEYVCVNGQFSPPGPYPNCRRSEAVQECEKIPPPIWGSYHCQTDNTGTERCYPACMEGYEFESPPAAEYVCINGQFSPPGPYPNCRKSEAVQECEKIPPPIWGSYHCQTDNTGTERCYPACMEGYEFESPPAAEYVCVNGQFSPPGPYPNCRKSEDIEMCPDGTPPVQCLTEPCSTVLCPVGENCV
ncbi:uncharacterized protein LOC144867633 [Branchiostoma floridae x Branchiostoma japonicum]